MEAFQYVPPELFSYLMSHLCCMATTFLTDGQKCPNMDCPVKVEVPEMTGFFLHSLKAPLAP